MFLEIKIDVDESDHWRGAPELASLMKIAYDRFVADLNDMEISPEIHIEVGKRCPRTSEVEFLKLMVD